MMMKSLILFSSLILATFTSYALGRAQAAAEAQEMSAQEAYVNAQKAKALSARLDDNNRALKTLRNMKAKQATYNATSTKK
jgi:type II secretory pathway pseudopilin PulG